MSTDWTAQDREFAAELLADPNLSQEDATHLMDQMDAYDARQKEAERKAQWAAKIDRSPTPVPQRPDRSAPGGGALGVSGQEISQFVNPPSQENPDKWVKAANAAEAGVDTQTGLRRGIRGASGLLSFDKKAQASAVEDALREEYADLDIPPDIPLVFEEEHTGMPMYMRLTPQGNLKPTLVNPVGADVGDFIEFAGELPTIALETAMGIGGAVVGSAVQPGAGTTIGGTVGAGVGGALSIPLRVKLAEYAGVSREVLDQIKQGDEAAWQGLFSGGGELLGFAVTGATSALRNFFGRQLDVDDLPALEAEIQRNLAKLEELERRTGQKVHLSLGELSGDPDLLVAEANMLNQQVGKAAREMRAQEIRSTKAARQALREMATQKPRAPTDDGFRSVEQVSEEVRQKLAIQPKDEMAGVQLEAQNALNAAEQGAQRDATLRDAYAMRDNIFAHAERMREAEGVAWAHYRSSVRWDPETRQSGVMVDNRGNTPIRQAAEELKRNQNEALLASLRNSYKGTLENMGFSPTQADEMVANDALAGLSQELLDPFHLHMALSHMKKELRLLEAGDTSRGWEASDLRMVITAIEDTMKGSPMVSRKGRELAASTTANVRAAWEDANLTTRRLHNLLDTKNMRTLLETRTKIGPDGTSYEMPNMPAGLLRSRMLTPDDPRFLIEAVEAVGGDPRVRVALANELRKKHADVALPGGKWNQSAHNEFMEQYEDHLNYLGLGTDINNVAQMGRAFDEAVQNLQKLETSLGAMYGRNVVDPTQPLNIADELLSGRVNYRQAERVINDIDRLDPRLGVHVREKVFEKLDLDLTQSNGLVLSSGKISEVLRSQRSTLRALFGQNYVDDLDALNDVLKLVDERTFRKSTKELMQTPLVSITRSLFGPLSKKQRFLTAVQRVARNQRAGAVTDLLRDPNALRQFVRLKDLNVRDPRYWIIVRGLGLGTYINDENPFKQWGMNNNLQQELIETQIEFENGTLQREKEERETPRRFGTIQ